MLICGENTNPLARFALLAQGEQVHLSTYPPLWPTRDPATGGNYDLKQAILIGRAPIPSKARSSTWWPPASWMRRPGTVWAD